MTKSIGVQVALLAFAAAILAGLAAGNSVTTVLMRALTVMVVALVLGQLAGWTVKSILRDHFSARKLAIDLDHLKKSKAMDETVREDGAAPSPTASTGR